MLALRLQSTNSKDTRCRQPFPTKISVSSVPPW